MVSTPLLGTLLATAVLPVLSSFLATYTYPSSIPSICTLPSTYATPSPLADPAKYPTIKELVEYYQISSECAACMVPPLGPFAGGKEDSRCIGYTMKQYCSPLFYRCQTMQVCSEASNTQCMATSCSTDEYYRVAAGDVCIDRSDAHYNGIANHMNYCLGLGVSAADVFARFEVDPKLGNRTESEIIAQVKGAIFCNDSFDLKGNDNNTRTAGALTVSSLTATSARSAATATTSSKNSAATVKATATGTVAKSAASRAADIFGGLKSLTVFLVLGVLGGML